MPFRMSIPTGSTSSLIKFKEIYTHRICLKSLNFLEKLAKLDLMSKLTFIIVGWQCQSGLNCSVYNNRKIPCSWFEVWTISKQHIQKLTQTDWEYLDEQVIIYLRIDQKIKYKVKLEAILTEDKIKESHVRWFYNVQ